MVRAAVEIAVREVRSYALMSACQKRSVDLFFSFLFFRIKLCASAFPKSGYDGTRTAVVVFIEKN